MHSDVFLTDAHYKHALAIIRSLGRKGLRVDVGSSFPSSLGAFSKYANQSFTYPNPEKSPERFLDFILKISKKSKYSVVMPVGYCSTLTLSRFKNRIERFVKVPIANYAQLRVASRKDETIVLAKKIGIPVPNSVMMKKVEPTHVEHLKYPVVLKGTTESGRLFYVSDSKELREKYLLLRRIQNEPIIAQEYIEGEGYGFFALFNYGEPRAIFMHRRIREYPITGGPSAVAESIYESKIKEYGLKMLKALNWHGVAMLEFKRDRKDKVFKLMEVNAKFWGSLDLAIASGIDFPYLLYQMATRGDIEPTFNYKRGVKFMWPFPDDFKHALANPLVFPRFFSDLLNVNVKKNFESNDLKPNIVLLLETAFSLWNGLRNYKHFRYPHGLPQRGIIL